MSDQDGKPTALTTKRGGRPKFVVKKMSIIFDKDSLRAIESIKARAKVKSAGEAIRFALKFCEGLDSCADACANRTLNRILGVALAQFGETDSAKVAWSSWPQAFGSTAGPRGGAGGQQITVFQVYAFEHEDGRRMKHCAGVWKNWNGVVGGKW